MLRVPASGERHANGIAGNYTQWILMAVLLGLGVGTGCDEEPLDLGYDRGVRGSGGLNSPDSMPDGQEADAARDGPLGPHDGTPADADATGRRIECDAPVGRYLADIAAFTVCVAPHIALACGNCHGARPFRFVSVPDAAAPEGHRANLDSFLNQIDLRMPANSEVLVHHGHAYIPLDSQAYRSLLRWIEARAEPPDGSSP